MHRAHPQATAQKSRENDALLKDVTSLAKFQQTLQELTEAWPTEKENPLFHPGDLVRSPPSSSPSLGPT